MATKRTTAERRSSSSDTEQHQLPAQAHQQMADFTESAASLFRGVEVVQLANQHATQRSALRLQQAAEQMRSAESPNELIGIQSTLMLGGFQEMALYLQDITLAMLRLQTQLISAQGVSQASEGTAAAGADGAAGGPLMAASAAADATSAATVAMLKSWSNMMGGALSGSDSRATH